MRVAENLPSFLLMVASVVYSLAQFRALRGMNPEYEHQIHWVDSSKGSSKSIEQVGLGRLSASVGGLEADHTTRDGAENVGACEPLSDDLLAALIFYAPIALSMIYATKEVDMQLLAAQQGWRLIYAYVDQEKVPHRDDELTDRPASAFLVHEEKKLACIAIRGTATIHDVVTDIRQLPVPFPESEMVDIPSASLSESLSSSTVDENWTTINRGRGLAVSGMATAAENLYQEHICSVLAFAKRGYRIRVTGHSLGGGVAALLGALIYRDLGRLCGDLDIKDGLVHVFAFGAPACVDANLSEFVEPLVTTVVLRDDVVPRLTPSSCRGLLKHLLHIKETWVKEHLSDDLMAITERAKTAWAPRWRTSFTLSRPSSIKAYCREQVRRARKFPKRYTAMHRADETFIKSDNLDSLAENDSEDFSEPSLGMSLAPDPRDMIDSEMNAVTRDSWASDGGLSVEGDLFFESRESTADEIPCANAVAELRSADRPRSTLGIGVPANAARTRIPVAGTSPAASLSELAILDELEIAEDESAHAVVLDETALPQMFVPGKIVHIYSWRGTYRATLVNKSFRALGKISLAGNMVSLVSIWL
jgi:Lipase (class 3)